MAAPTPTPAPTAAATAFYVSTTGSDSSAGSSTSPWRTIANAVAVAPAGSTIRVFSGTYAPFTVRRAHLTISPVTGDTVTVTGGTTAITIYASDTTLRGLHVTGASAQGIWVDTVSDVLLTGLTVSGNLGHGVQIIRSTGVEVSDSQISSNTLSGIRELDGTSAGRYLDNVITDNGHDGQLYNGDGLLLKGSGAEVRGNTILRNGDSDLYEHGIYASSVAIGYVIEGNVIRDNAASGIKASGSGTVSGNTISGSPRGIVFADSGGVVHVTANTVGATQDVILVTSNCVLTRYQSDYNTFNPMPFGYLGQALDLPAWRHATGLDLHSQ
jgi:parallel beta-helix repeat protein